MSLKIVHVLMIIIIACMLYYVINDINCNCLINGFSVAGSNINITKDLILDGNTCPSPPPPPPPSPPPSPPSPPCISGKRTIRVGDTPDWPTGRPKLCGFVESEKGYHRECYLDCNKCYQVDKTTGIGKPCRERYPDPGSFSCVADESVCQP